MKIRCLILLMLASLTLAMTGMAAGPSQKWEKVTSAPAADGALNISDAETAEVKVLEGSWLYIWISKPLMVKVVTILGQPVSQHTFTQAGIYRLKINTKGIYIIKLGTVTRRVIV